ncbi:alpha/beta hydrolase [uncultured Aquimarina sp.]|uniref:alpha/beta hydrolase n=1 Tax=uncultured Aquimarina sp. TaxID=575652 RepID=UPI0026110C43|nr:alpha/beta hydrolase [uncultured Aquimarina sp.]
MKKILKIIGWVLLTILVSGIGFSVYKYNTDDMLRAMIHQDESKLSYGPLKEIVSLDGFNFEEYELQVNDSIKIYTYLFKSHTKHKGNIFFIHGSGGNAAYWSQLYKPLLDEGYAVYAADWRGYGKADGTPNYKGVLEDTEAAFNDFMNKTKNDNLKTIVYGMSLGGQLAIKITVDNQNKVDALVLDGAFESAQQIAIDYAPFQFLKNRAIKHPEKFNQLYVGSRDIKEIKDIPKLIIHSVNDVSVPISHGKKLFKNALEPKEFWETKTPHIMTLKNISNQAIKRINNLMDM